jgi:hypothetical protein
MEVKYIKSKFGNQFFIQDESYFHEDKDIAKSLDVTLDQYRHVLINNFNGEVIISGEVYFNTEEDVDNALEWIESILLIDKLRGA